MHMPESFPIGLRDEALALFFLLGGTKDDSCIVIGKGKLFNGFSFKVNGWRSRDRHSISMVREWLYWVAHAISSCFG